jgi:hypothetical protein
MTTYVTYSSGVSDFAQALDTSVDTWNKMNIARAFIKVVEAITEVLMCRGLLKPANSLFVHVHDTRTFLRNATAHAHGSPESILAGYLAAKAFLEIKLLYFFDQIYRSNRKEQIRNVETATNLPFGEWCEKGYVPPKPETAEEDADSILEKASMGLGKETPLFIRQAKSSIIRQIQSLAKLNPRAKQGLS